MRTFLIVALAVLATPMHGRAESVPATVIEFINEHRPQNDPLSAECVALLTQRINSAHARGSHVALHHDAAVRRCLGGRWSEFETVPSDLHKKFRAAWQNGELVATMKEFHPASGEVFQKWMSEAPRCPLLTFDLSDSVGGRFEGGAISILDQLAPRPGLPIASQVDAYGQREHRFVSSTMDRIPLDCALFIIKISGSTFSTAELIPARLKSWYPDRVCLEGEHKTFGKNVFQYSRFVGDYKINVPGGVWFVGAGEERFSVASGVKPDTPDCSEVRARFLRERDHATVGQGH